MYRLLVINGASSIDHEECEGGRYRVLAPTLDVDATARRTPEDDLWRRLCASGEDHHPEMLKRSLHLTRRYLRVNKGIVRQS